MKTLKNLVILFVLLFCGGSARAGLDLGFAKEDGGRPGTFLDFAASARSLGMGGAHSAVADDASAVYWNPAGLAQINRKDIVTLYSSLFEDTNFGFFGYAQPTVDMGTFGLGVVSLRSGDFEKRDEIGQVQGSFSSADTAVLLSYGAPLSDRLALGGTIKGIRQEIDTYSGSGLGLDAGALYQWKPRIQFGLTARNIVSPKITLDSTAEKYPFDIRGGVKFSGLKNILLALDLNKTTGRSVKPHFGAEWTAAQLLIIRAGLDETQMTAGLGFKINDWTLDYAFGYHDAAADFEDLDASHRFGFHVNFGRKASEQAASLRWIDRGQAHLQKFREWMESQDRPSDEERTSLINATRQVIRRQGYLNPGDLFAAQGYIYYFEGDYERSVPALGEAYTLKPEDTTLANHLEKARAQMTEERTKEIVSLEIRKLQEYYEKADWKSAVKSCEKILSFEPNNIDAQAYMEDARNKVNEPIQREMKIAKLKFERGEFLDSIKSFNRVKDMDPDNSEAADYISKAIGELENQAQQQVATEPSTTGRQVYAIEQDPQKSRSLYSQGVIFYSEGKVMEAARIWQQAIQLDANNTLAKNAYNRARIELKESK